ncbi:ABC transporter ATP-binding protein [Bacillus chungangensis]|uniref:ABC transport system ATP-binding protein n=1 Tax=Bacillus chungangensis TaxID=587633 RepID=A0ABT9WXD0_9BACI|nr:ABC transporter ATP-binding protein [Bacillus chungangensis]MDQ0177952.1 putative ABC transport system ATP-binding protein [Bacillus chungangensis]
MTTVMLDVKEVDKIYGEKVTFHALKKVSFQVNKGEFVGIMGPSGSGKTTLLNTISTIDSPTSGTVTINGSNPYHLKKDGLAHFRRRELGFVFQDFNLLDTLTVRQNILLPLTLDGRSRKEMEKRLQDIAHHLGIEGILQKRTFEISGGQAQRTAIARAVIHDPSIVLADEPTGNLDSNASEDVLSILRQLNKQGATMIMVTHDAYAASFCDRILFIKDGKLRAEIKRSATQELFQKEISATLSSLRGSEA